VGNQLRKLSLCSFHNLFKKGSLGCSKLSKNVSLLEGSISNCASLKSFFSK